MWSLWFLKEKRDFSRKTKISFAAAFQPPQRSECFVFRWFLCLLKAQNKKGKKYEKNPPEPSKCVKRRKLGTSVENVECIKRMPETCYPHTQKKGKKEKKLNEIFSKSSGTKEIQIIYLSVIFPFAKQHRKSIRGKKSF